MMIKLIAIDLDGTLLDSDMTISKENQEAIKYATNKGVKVMICTGRPYIFTTLYKEMLDLDTPLVSFNGGQIKHKEFNEQTFLSQSQIEKAMALLEEYNIGYMLTTETTMYHTPSKRAEYLKEMSKKIPEHLRAKFELVTDYKSLIHRHQFHKVLIVEQDASKYQGVYNLVKEAMTECDVVASSSFYVEILPKGISKGNALQKVANFYGINQEETMAIGDQENDVTMIRYAGIGIAMGNAKENIKAIADDITDTNINNGVAKAIRKYVT